MVDALERRAREVSLSLQSVAKIRREKKAANSLSDRANQKRHEKGRLEVEN